MKKRFTRFLALALVIVTVLTGCEEKKTTDPENSGMISAPPPHGVAPYCYTLNVSPGPYKYGEEINIQLYMQFSDDYGYGSPLFGTDYGSFAMSIQENTSFEIVGDKEISFGIIKFSDYLCGNYDGNALRANFKVKINDPTYITDTIKINTTIAICHMRDGELIYQDEDRSNKLTEITFIADLQGILLYYTPYGLNHYNKTTWLSSCLENSHDVLLAKSFDREYLAGVPAEELIDRYIEYKLGENIHLYMYRDETGDCRISYISKDVRFQVYMSDDNEWVEKFDYFYKDVPKNFLKSFLPYAQEAGIISESEFEIEKARMEDYRTKVVKLELPITPEVTAFSIPEGDDFYNYVLDLRK